MGDHVHSFGPRGTGQCSCGMLPGGGPFRAPPNLDLLTRTQLIETIHTLVDSLNRLAAAARGGT